jgi:putative phosphoribosyl transferase
LIVGGRDGEVIALNAEALALLVHCPRQLEVIPQRHELFEEPRTLRQVARLARAWFELYLPRTAKAALQKQPDSN